MNNKVIVIGGSAGSFQIILEVVSLIPKNYRHTVILCLHRLKSVRTGFVEALNVRSAIKISEPDDKERILPNSIYLAPSNYHLCVNSDYSFSLSTEKTFNHSRPSIDMLFSTSAFVFKENLIGVLLSGANKDGAIGVKHIEDNLGKVIIQQPEDCQVDTMSVFAIENTEKPEVLNSVEIIQYLKNI